MIGGASVHIVALKRERGEGENRELVSMFSLLHSIVLEALQERLLGTQTPCHQQTATVDTPAISWPGLHEYTAVENRSVLVYVTVPFTTLYGAPQSTPVKKSYLC